MPQADREDFENSCAYEICEMGEDEDAICSFADAVATRCAELQMPVMDWRSEDFCGNYKKDLFI